MFRTVARTTTVAAFTAFTASCSRAPAAPSDAPAAVAAPTPARAAHDPQRAERSRVVCDGPPPTGTPACRPSSEFIDREDPCSVGVGHDCESHCSASCESCDAACRATCSGCFVACSDSACEQRCASQEGTCRGACARERLDCATTRCANEYRTCRTKLVGDWLASDCRSLCLPYDRCNAATASWAGTGAIDCDARFVASAAGKPACNPFASATLRWAQERKVLDPSWAKNGCDDVCSRIWRCAKTECFRSDCNEPIKRFATCAKRTPKAGACDLLEISASLLCQEPE